MNISELFRLLSVSQNLERARLLKKMVDHDTWRRYSDRRRAELWHCGYPALVASANVPRLSGNLLNALGRQDFILVEPIETLFNLVISTLLDKEALKKEKGRK